MFYPTRRCDPRLFDRDLSSRAYLVTGANSGVGLETTRQLVRQGAHVILGCRRTAAGEEAAATMADLRGSTEVLELDLASLDSVRRAAATVLDTHDRLDGLVNNAGVMAPPTATKTRDGFDMQFGTNHLGHFLLTELLLDRLKASAPSRIVCLSSVAHVSRGNEVTLHFEDLNWEIRPYDRRMAYAESKLANVLHARELARRLEGTGVTAVSVHPGWVRSNLISSMGPAWIQNVLLVPFSPLLTLMDNKDGAQTSLHCLLDDDVPDHSGAYYSQNSLLYPDKKHRKGGWPMASPNPNAHDDDLARRLYEVSLELVGRSD